MKFGSWTYSGDQIDLDVYNNDTDVKVRYREDQNVFTCFLVLTIQIHAILLQTNRNTLFINLYSE